MNGNIIKVIQCIYFLDSANCEFGVFFYTNLIRLLAKSASQTNASPWKSYSLWIEPNWIQLNGAELNLTRPNGIGKWASQNAIISQTNHTSCQINRRNPSHIFLILNNLINIIYYSQLATTESSIDVTRCCVFGSFSVRFANSNSDTIKAIKA